jgi:hypothetical protein
MGEIRAGTRGICIQTGVSFHHLNLFFINLGGRMDTRALLSSGPQLPFFFFFFFEELFFFCVFFFLQMFGEEIWAFGIDTIVCFFAHAPFFFPFFPGEPLPHWRSGSLFIWGWGRGVTKCFFLF